MPKSPNNSVELCHAGQLLEVRLEASTEKLHEAAGRMEISSEKILQTLTLLNEYAIRDKEKLESLEKRCDGLDKARSCGQKLKTDFASHIAEYRESKRIESESKQFEVTEGRSAGRKYGTSSGIISGVTSGITTAFLTFWYWFTHHGGPQ